MDDEIAVVNELEQFQQDLLDSVRQMKAGKAARVTEVPLSAAAEARVKVGVSQSAFAKLIGVSLRTLQDWEQGRRQPTGAAQTHCYVLLASIRKHCGICSLPEVKSSTDCSD